MAILITVLVIAGLSYVVYHHHSTYRLYARFSVDWAARADRYADSLMRLYMIDLCELADTPFAHTIEMLRRHDKENLATCTAHAHHWREKIPARFRAYYLRTSG